MIPQETQFSSSQGLIAVDAGHKAHRFAQFVINNSKCLLALRRAWNDTQAQSIIAFGNQIDRECQEVKLVNALLT
jgi:hypothetical protein